ncbi:MAG: hypothetical protein WAW36_02985 [Methylovulum miyakonense]
MGLQWCLLGCGILGIDRIFCILKKVKQLLIFPFIFHITSAWCGGDDWLFRVVDIKTETKNCTRIYLESVEASQRFPASCKSFEVLACYSWSWWNPNTPVSRDQHNQAIGFLRHAKTSSTPIRFGEMGTGFGDVIQGKECHASSTALEIMNDIAVYSFFEWP